MKPKQRKVLFAGLALVALADFGVTQSPITPFNPEGMPIAVLRNMGPASAAPTDAEAESAIKTLLQLPGNKTESAIGWLIRGTPCAHRRLAATMYATTEVGLLVQILGAMATLEAEACELAPYVAPFVHFPVPAVNEAACECLRLLAGADAVTTALKNGDPWPTWFPLHDGGSKQATLQYVMDDGQPAVMRAILFGNKNTTGHFSTLEAQPLALQWLLSEDVILNRAALRALDRSPSWIRGSFEPSPNGAQHEPGLALAGGPRTVRSAVGAMLRGSQSIDWPTTLAECLRTTGELPFLQREAALQLQQPRRLTDPAFLQRQLARDPVGTAARLRQLPAPPPPEFVPILAAQLGKYPTSQAHYELLARSEPGRRALRERTKTDRREPALLCAAMNRVSQPRAVASFVEALLERWRKGLSQATASHVSHLHYYLSELPWQETANDLDSLENAVRQLWEQADETRRTLYLPLLSACDRDASYAAENLLSMWSRPGSNRPGIAEALLVAGHREFVLGELDHLDLGYEICPRLRTLRLAHDIRECLALPSDRFLPKLDHLLETLPRGGCAHYHGLSPSQRSLLAKRIVEELEEFRDPAIAKFLDRLGGEFDASIDEPMAAFYARRHTFDQGVDPLAEAVADATARFLPDHVARALRRGVLPPRVLPHIHAAGAFASARWLAAAPDLLAVAEFNPQGDLGTLLGRLWTAAGVFPADGLLQCLRNDRTAEIAIRAFEQMPALPPDIFDALLPLLDTSDQLRRSQILRVLLLQGERGITLATNSDLVPEEEAAKSIRVLLMERRPRPDALLHYFAQHPSQLPPQTFGNAAWLLGDHLITRDRLRLCAAGKVTAIDRDWLWLATVAEAELRRQFVESVPKERALSPIACGVLVELLDDEDAGVRAAACNQLLAVRERAILCRRPLSEYAAKTPEVAARVREVLDSER